jgi:hypothetical protein
MASKRLSSMIVVSGFGFGPAVAKKEEYSLPAIVENCPQNFHCFATRCEGCLIQVSKVSLVVTRMRRNRGTEKAASQNGPLCAAVADKASPLPQTISVSMGRSFDVQ